MSQPNREQNDLDSELQGKRDAQTHVKQVAIVLGVRLNQAQRKEEADDGKHNQDRVPKVVQKQRPKEDEEWNSKLPQANTLGALSR